MLKRDIKRWDLVLLMINSIIGAGIFGLPSKTFELTGVYSIPAILICALFMIVIILNFSEVASQFNKTGGPYLYTSKAFGKSLGYIIGWLSLVSRIAAYAALINLMLDYLSYINVAFNNQSIRIFTIILISTFIFLINYRGVKNSSRLNNILAIAKLIPLFIFIIVGLYFIDFDLLNFDQPVPSINDFSSTILVLVFAFTGFEAVVINSGEMSNPKRDIPFALIISALFVAVFYTLIQLVTVGTYPDLASSNKPIADAADYFLGSVGGLLITIGAVISIGGTINANLLAGSRLPFAFSEANQFPSLFSKTHPKTGVPHISLIIYTIITILVSVSGTFIYALSISVISKVMVFAIISAALIKFRKENNKENFQLRYGYFSAILGIIICIWMLFASNLSDFIDVIITIIVGVLLYIIFRIKKNKN
jgi:APA family basic amino acid/polyamine antiporter